MSEEATAWSSIAARVVRSVLARKDVGYAQLSEGLAALGVVESERGLASRVSRGRIKLSLLLQIFEVTSAKVPPLWAQACALSGPWESRASAVCAAELSCNPIVTVEELARRMIVLGADLSEKTLVTHLRAGTISLPEFLQSLVALNSRSLEGFVDFEDLVAVARMTSVTSLS